MEDLMNKIIALVTVLSLMAITAFAQPASFASEIIQTADSISVVDTIDPLFADIEASQLSHFEAEKAEGEGLAGAIVGAVVGGAIGAAAGYVIQTAANKNQPLPSPTARVVSSTIITGAIGAVVGAKAGAKIGAAIGAVLPF
jgi:hypothetical protein